MSNSVIFKIESHETELSTLCVEMSAATVIAFDLNFENLDYSAVIADICQVAPHMMSLDADLMESYDDAGRTPLKWEDRKAVSAFLVKYRGRIPDDLKDEFA